MRTNVRQYRVSSDRFPVCHVPFHPLRSKRLRAAVHPGLRSGTELRTSARQYPQRRGLWATGLLLAAAAGPTVGEPTVGELAAVCAKGQAVGGVGVDAAICEWYAVPCACHAMRGPKGGAPEGDTRDGAIATEHRRRAHPRDRGQSRDASPDAFHARQSWCRPVDKPLDRVVQQVAAALQDYPEPDARAGPVVVDILSQLYPCRGD
jgi:hypothetical protein